MQLDLEVVRATGLPVSRAHTPVRTPSPVPSQLLLGPPGPSASPSEEESLVPLRSPATNLRYGRGAKGTAASQPKGKAQGKEKEV
ncbi:hypothetical protein N7481_003217 [Penicillium waksmanii]|uniref:uncharacterized protein n=1 Tax=Penicillium waksmanii TaxID=69791 RepID=UPI0025488750|nr:uncharacterized protein N7481_003217 [Penicillium waksmanii]KAJ5988007.1 hypothetical protein N7481_003217 [Penicillium waksmanii]